MQNLKSIAPWQKKLAKVPFPVLVIGSVLVILVVLAIVVDVLRYKPLDIDSPAIFSQVPTGIPLKVVNAQQVVDYLQAHGVTVSAAKPFSNTKVKASQALALSIQDQPAVILSYDDANALLRDRALFSEDEAQSIAAAGRNDTALALPTAKPTKSTDKALADHWNVDSLSNVLLLTDKGMAVPLRSALLSHLNSLIVASVRPGFPTPTPG